MLCWRNSSFYLPTVSDLRAQVGLDQFSITHLVAVIHYELDWSCDIDQNPQVNAAVGCWGRQATELPFHLWSGKQTSALLLLKLFCVATFFLCSALLRKTFLTWLNMRNKLDNRQHALLPYQPSTGVIPQTTASGFNSLATIKVVPF